MTFHKVETPEEAKMVSKLAVEVFGPLSRIIVPNRPKWAHYATNDDGEIVGGIILKRLGKSVGLVDFIFVHERGRGQGLGPGLLDLGVKELDDAGCSTQIALIREDNTPSWNMFAKRGYVVPNIFKALFGLSLKAALYSLFLTFANTGYSVWVRDQEASPDTVSPDKRLRLRWGAAIALLFVVPVAAAIGRFGAYGPQWLIAMLAMVAGVSVLRMILTYPVARSYGPVEWRLSHGGAMLTAVLAALGSWWPHFGFWAPKEPYWHFSSFRRYEGVSALIGWILTIAIYPASFLVPIDGVADGIRSLSIQILIYQMLPVFPFEGMDGFRVLSWNRVAYTFGTVATLLCFAHALFW